jgi:ABC-type maltose transport system permease subunit
LALAVLGSLPVFFAVATLQLFLVRGICMGEVKG